MDNVFLKKILAKVVACQGLPSESKIFLQEQIGTYFDILETCMQTTSPRSPGSICVMMLWQDHVLRSTNRGYWWRYSNEAGLKQLPLHLVSQSSRWKNGTSSFTHTISEWRYGTAWLVFQKRNTCWTKLHSWYDSSKNIPPSRPRLLGTQAIWIDQPWFIHAFFPLRTLSQP